MRASRRSTTFYSVAAISILLFVEFGDVVAPGQGLRVVAFDAHADPATQPLREIFRQIAKESPAGSGILMDYSPQAVNWYLPGYKPALLPDPATLSWLGKKNDNLPTMVEPEWHITYPDTRNGFWICDPHCDFVRVGNPVTDDRYVVHSNALAKDFAFCVVRRWKNHPWNNAPSVLYRPESLTLEGLSTEHLVLARRCPKG
jgi:hypothetical protein